MGTPKRKASKSVSLSAEMTGYCGLLGACNLTRTSGERVSGILDVQCAIGSMRGSREGSREMGVLVDCGRAARCGDAFLDRFGDYDQDGGQSAQERVTFAHSRLPIWPYKV